MLQWFDMSRLPVEWEHGFSEENGSKTLVAAEVLNILAIVLFPSFSAIDYIMFRGVPQQFFVLLRVRLIVLMLLGMNLILLRELHRRGIARRYSRYLAWGVFVPALAGLDVILLLAGGAESPYYAGVSLVLIAMLVSMPWPFVEMALSAITVWLQYAIIMVLFDRNINWNLFEMNNYFIISTLTIGLTWSYTGNRLRRAEFLNRMQLAEEKEKTERLLLNVLPREIADELKREGRVEPRFHELGAVLFTDFVGFTSIAEDADPKSLLAQLDQLFSEFDNVSVKHSLERLKTIGDSYMCVAGLPSSNPTALLDCILGALAMMHAVELHNKCAPAQPWQIRMGVHAGPLIAGVVGQQKFAYDVWGDTVNTASRLEHESEPGKINISASSLNGIEDFFEITQRGELNVKGKKLPVQMAFIERLRPEFSQDSEGRFPNEQFQLERESIRAAAPAAPEETIPADDSTGEWNWLQKLERAIFVTLRN